MFEGRVEMSLINVIIKYLFNLIFDVFKDLSFNIIYELEVGLKSKD